MPSQADICRLSQAQTLRVLSYSSIDCMQVSNNTTGDMRPTLWNDTLAAAIKQQKLLCTCRQSHSPQAGIFQDGIWQQVLCCSDCVTNTILGNYSRLNSIPVLATHISITVLTKTICSYLEKLTEVSLAKSTTPSCLLHNSTILLHSHNVLETLFNLSSSTRNTITRH